MKESLRASSFNRFKSNPSSYIAIGVMGGLFLLISMLIAFISPTFLLLSVPLIGFPFLFASHIASYYLQINQQVTFSAFLRYYYGFFRAQFRSSFRGIISLLKSLIFYFVSVLIAALIFVAIFTNKYGSDFTEALTNFVSSYFYSTNITYEELIAMLNANDGMLLTFIFYVSAFGIPLAMLAFIYYISFASLSIYYRANVAFAAPPLLRMTISNTYSLHRRNMRKDWFVLNWPLLLLSFVGMAGFAVLDILVVKRVDLLPAFVIVGGVAMLVFYLPFYFTNMEVIYKKYETNFKEGNQRAIEEVLRKIQNSIDLSEEEKRSLEQSLQGQNSDEEE